MTTRPAPPVALGFAREKTPADAARSQDELKREGEQTVALRLYAATSLENATVTGDALNHNQPQTRAVLDAGGDYFYRLLHHQPFPGARLRLLLGDLAPGPWGGSQSRNHWVRDACLRQDRTRSKN